MADDVKTQVSSIKYQDGRKIDDRTGLGYYEELPEGWKVGKWNNFVNRVNELNVGMEYIIHSYHAYDKLENGEYRFKPFMPYQVYKVKKDTTREELKQWAGRIYVRK